MPKQQQDQGGTWKELDKDVRKSYEEWGIAVPKDTNKSKS